MSDKYMEEIEEILKRAEEVMPEDRRAGPERAGRKTKSTGGSSNPMRRFSGGWKLGISAGKLMLASFALFILALAISATSLNFEKYLVIIGLILFVVAFALFFIKPGHISQEKRWRGRIIEDRPTTYWARIKQWFSD